MSRTIHAGRRGGDARQLVWLLTASLILPAGAALAADLESDEGKTSYAVGYTQGMSVTRQGVELDAAAAAQGLRDALSGKDAAISEEDMQTAITKLQAELQAKMQAKKAEMQAKQAEMSKMGPENLKRGKAYLEANAKKDGVVVTESGLQYKVVTEGDGKSPTASDTVKVHYRGTLVDGSEFDSSYSRGQPASFQVNRVIPGWTEALQLMKVGSKWEVVIPSDLAYGERGAPGAIGPNETLVFEVELLDVL